MGDKDKTHFRVTLEASREDVRGNLRRTAKGIAYVNRGVDCGEALLVVENLKYLGTASDGLPYYYAGWLTLANGHKVSIGPVSIDNKGNGKVYWRFALARAGSPGIELRQITGFAVTVETMGVSAYARSVIVLSGMVRKGEASAHKKSALDCKTPSAGMARTAHNNVNNKVPKHMSYSWWPLWKPGESTKEAPFLFGYRVCNAGVEQVAFGIPGTADCPLPTGEAGEWLPTGTDVSSGYWVYHQKAGPVVSDRGLGVRGITSGRRST